ncbi:hypothetical protein HYALB_00006711 [Hymenoscyphus albidus]|uniref:RING-type domain-containing protein n=1 Tax=Hymenoscyphus albidus TaxID=595503 RepID=A0A9N9Q4J8_9HELO|nr:hypothetical protein HYALB_00006711 [Hymenoscyphus albidus]
MEDLDPAPVPAPGKTNSSTKREVLRKIINPKRILRLAHRAKTPTPKPGPSPSASKRRPQVLSIASLLTLNVSVESAAMDNVVDLVSDSDDDEVEIKSDSPIIIDDPYVIPSSPPRAPNTVPQTPLQQQDAPNGYMNGALPGINQMLQPPNGNAADGWQRFGDYVLDEDLNDEMIARMYGPQDAQVGLEANPWVLEQPQGPPVPPAQPDPPAQQFQPEGIEPQRETRLGCIDAVLAIFPDICRDHVGKLYETISYSSDLIIAHILDKTEKGSPYPKAKDMQKTLKRKRQITEEDAATLKYGAADSPEPLREIHADIRTFLSFEFALTPMSFIDATLNQTGYRLFHAYRVLEQAQREWEPQNPPYMKLRSQRRTQDKFSERTIQKNLDSGHDERVRVEFYLEIQAARKVRAKADAVREAQRLHEIEEAANEQRAQRDGTMSECGCCFGDYPMNRMIHCDGDTLHWFCRGCAKKMAATEIGASKYELHCMSMDSCQAGFSNDQRLLFLDEHTLVALERTEQEAMLRMAGIENLASCPFCPFAAEYPPVEINKEFKCQAPDCEKISCRQCKLETHIPKSCEESARENGLSIRRQIEEARSAALIRKCNKCGTSFIKEEGCNKMACTKCGNIQCYVCSKSCGYDHFNDPHRGGKPGNCPLFEDVEARHDEEVGKAEKEALEKIRAEHPEYTEEDLRIRFSDEVKKDEERRKSRHPGMAGVPMGHPGLQRAIHG